MPSADLEPYVESPRAERVEGASPDPRSAVGDRSLLLRRPPLSGAPDGRALRALYRSARATPENVNPAEITWFSVIVCWT